MKLISIFCLLALLLSFATAQAGHRRVLIIGLDGTTGSQFHYQTLVQKQAPVFADLMNTGKFTPCLSPMDPKCARAQSGYRTGKDFRWLTGPGWCSVETGVDNTKHQIKDNSDDALSVFATTSKIHPTIQKVLISKGMKTAAGGVAAFMTAKKNGSVHSGSLDYECGADAQHKPLVKFDDKSSCNLTVRQAGDGSDSNRDARLTDFLESQVNDPSIDLVMGVYDQIDAQGHMSGFSSNPHYLQAITTADGQAGKLIRAVENGVSQRHEEWLVIVTSDHGGHNIALWGNHDVVDHDDDQIPFVIKTFGTSTPLRDLTYPVTHMDVHPTVEAWFGLPLTPGLDGHVQGVAP